MTKCVDHPSNLWLDAELLVEESMTHVYVQDEVLIIRTCLVRRSPATLRYLKLTIVDESLDTILILLGKQLVPHIEVFHFDVRECSSGVSLKLINQCIEDVLDSSSLIINDIRSKEVLLVSFSPSDVVMRVRHNVHSEVLGFLLSLAQVVVLFTIEISRILVVNDLVLSCVEESNTLIFIQRFFVSVNDIAFNWRKLIERHCLRLLFHSWLWLVMRRRCDERAEFWLLLLTHCLLVELLIQGERILNIWL